MDEKTKEMMEALRKPFAANEIEWRAQRVGITNGKPWAMVLAYVTNRAIMNRLDEVFGINGWRNEFVKWNDHATVCGLSCLINGEWLTKYDGAEETDIEAVKGGLSDSMKRAAVQWGIGRYLYGLTENFAECSTERQRGDDWRKAETKDKQTFWWKIPTLPDWALPKDSGKSGQKCPSGAEKPKPAPADKNNQKPRQNSLESENSDNPTNETDMMISFMAGLGVAREDLEMAIGGPVESFNADDVAAIRDAARRMKSEGCDFQTAMMGDDEA